VGYIRQTLNQLPLISFFKIFLMASTQKITEGAPAHGTLAHLLPPGYKRQIAAWLEEDAPSFDYGGFVVGEDMAEARLLGKSKVCIFVYSVL
jgi:hypothetical protein